MASGRKESQLSLGVQSTLVDHVPGCGSTPRKNIDNTNLSQWVTERERAKEREIGGIKIHNLSSLNKMVFTWTYTHPPLYFKFFLAPLIIPN